jgi:hypothetical protein
MVCRPVVAASHYFDEEQVPVPGPHRSEKLESDPDLHRNLKVPSHQIRSA